MVDQSDLISIACANRNCLKPALLGDLCEEPGAVRRWGHESGNVRKGCGIARIGKESKRNVAPGGASGLNELTGIRGVKAKKEKQQWGGKKNDK